MLKWMQPSQHLHGAALGEHNREVVREYMREHLGCTIKEIAQGVGGFTPSVSKHFNAIRSEWKNKR